MPITRHIAEFTERGWDLIHPLNCPANLLECPVTELCRDLRAAPKTGRFWADAVRRGKEHKLVLGDPVPRDIQGTSRKTGHHFTQVKMRPR